MGRKENCVIQKHPRVDPTGKSMIHGYTPSKVPPCVDKKKGKPNSELPLWLTTRWTTFSRLVNRIGAVPRALYHVTLCFLRDTCAFKTIVWLSVDPSLTVCIISVFVITSWKEKVLSILIQNQPSDNPPHRSNTNMKVKHNKQLRLNLSSWKNVFRAIALASNTTSLLAFKRDFALRK